MSPPASGSEREPWGSRSRPTWTSKLWRPLAADETRARFWVRHVRVGVALSEVAALLVGGYAMVAGRPHAPVVLGIAVMVALGSPALLLVPMERVSRTLVGPLLFYAWSVVVTVTIVVAALLDGGADSPLVWLFLLTMTFAALAYPPWGVVLVGSFMVAGFGLVAWVDGAMSMHVAVIAAVLMTFTVMTAWVSGNHWATYDEQLRLGARLVELDRAREQFVAATSHEVRTPVASILGYVELLEDAAHGADPRHLAAIRRNAQRLSDLSEDLLVLSCWAAEEPRLHGSGSPDRTVLSEVVGAVRETMAPLADRNGVQLVLAAPAEPVAVVGSAHYLEKVVLNLVSNAVKYSPYGGMVQCRVDRAAGGAVLQVSDQGIGIAEADLERLFTRFYRAQSARDAAIGGIGLGLSIVHEILAAYGGSVDVTSVEGVGTTFTVWLLTSDGDPESDETGPREEGSSTGAGAGSGHREIRADGGEPRAEGRRDRDGCGAPG